MQVKPLGFASANRDRLKMDPRPFNPAPAYAEINPVH